MASDVGVVDNAVDENPAVGGGGLISAVDSFGEVVGNYCHSHPE